PPPGGPHAAAPGGQRLARRRGQVLHPEHQDEGDPKPGVLRDRARADREPDEEGADEAEHGGSGVGGGAAPRRGVFRDRPRADREPDEEGADEPEHGGSGSGGLVERVLALRHGGHAIFARHARLIKGAARSASRPRRFPGYSRRFRRPYMSANI